MDITNQHLFDVTRPLGIWKTQANTRKETRDEVYARLGS